MDKTFLLTLLSAVLIFAFFIAALGLGLLFGKKRDKCSCMAAKRVMREYGIRQKSTKKRKEYDPQTLNPASLPVVSDDISLQ
ncbi:MAG: hypothetical protein LBQ54_13505 [Planctomycetaceae bacterium]|jgi:preprotein translocase subunit SecG|nr:hypothetical protein [Planctomycetaceae bacterium]